MEFNIHIAGIKEPFWCLIDDKGMRHIEAISLYKCEDFETRKQAYGFTLGPLHVNVVFGAGAGLSVSDKTTAYLWTATAGFCVVSAIGGASWESAFFACTSAWLAWIIALRA